MSFVAIAIHIAYMIGNSDGREGKEIVRTVHASSSPAISPVEPRANDVYFPNTERLAPDEIRVIACGIGMPATSAAQAAARVQG